MGDNGYVFLYSKMGSPTSSISGIVHCCVRRSRNSSRGLACRPNSFARIILKIFATFIVSREEQKTYPE